MGRRKVGELTHGMLDRLSTAVDDAGRVASDARARWEKADRFRDGLREQLARVVCRDVLAGGAVGGGYAGFLRAYILSGPLWEAAGRDAYFAADPAGGKELDNAGAWSAVYAAVARLKGWE
jgi:hypothetical protein